METKSKIRDLPAPKMDSACQGLTDAQDDAARELLSFIAGKWPLWILGVLWNADGPMRFSRIQDEVEGVSQKVLTQCLRRLERHNLVVRKVFSEVTPRVEYTLTPLGEQLLEQVTPLWAWVASRIDSLSPPTR